MKKLISLTFILLLFQTIYSQNKKQIDWNADLDYLFENLSEKHYNFFSVRAKNDFLSGINAIKQQSGNLTDFQIALKTQQLIATFGDSHTTLDFRRLLDKNKILPLQLLWASDGLYILHTTPENEAILGCQLLAINGFPVATVIDSLSTLLTIDNRAMVKSRVPQYIPSLQILEYFGFADSGQVELSLKNGANQNLVYALKTSAMSRKNRVSFEPDAYAFSIINENAFFTDCYYPDEKIYYMLYNRCLSKELEEKYGNKEKAKKMPSFKEFEQKALKTLKTKKVDKIVFDMRHNSGGNSAQGTAFIEKLAKFLNENPDVKMYVVIGKRTFSSAILNALDFKRLTNAVFVGEETAGKPNHFGEMRNFQLPNSKLQVNYSTKYFKNVDDEVSTIIPDVTIEMSFPDLKQGIDPVYEWIKKQ